MHILLFILVFIVAILVFGLSVIGFILRTLFGIGRKSSSSHHRQAESGHTSQQGYKQENRYDQSDSEETFANTTEGKRHQKIFAKDEGEYVDFEEVKD